MMADVKEKAWDRVKIVCRQPYAIGKQFGLSFLCIKTNEVSLQSEKQEVNNNQNRLNSFFGRLEERYVNVYIPNFLFLVYIPTIAIFYTVKNCNSVCLTVL